MSKQRSHWRTVAFVGMTVVVALLLVTAQYTQAQTSGKHYLPFGVCHIGR